MSKYLLSVLIAVMAIFPLISVATTETRSSVYEYDSNGRVIKEVLAPNTDTTCMATDYGYDVRGNLATQSVRSCSSTEGASTPTGNYAFAVRTTTITYGDGYSRFPTQTQNPAGHIETKSFDTRFGAVVKDTIGLLASDSAQVGMVTTATYDEFGRLSKQINPDVSNIAVSYELCSAGGCTDAALSAGAVYRIARTETVAPTVWIYYDAMHRPVLTEHQGHSGTGNPPIIYTRKTYDSLGRLIWDTRPYYAGDTQWVFGPGGTYDILDRSTTETTPAGQVFSYAYRANITIKTDEKLHSTTKITNSQGWVTEIDDANSQSLKHFYTPFGLLSKTEDPKGNVIEVLYDIRGRKTELRDPDLGRKSYTYNAAGDLITTSHWYNVQATYVYDSLGRVIKRSEKDLISEWSFDKNFDGTRCQYGVGQVCQNKSSNGYANTQTFDFGGRPSVSTTTTGTQSFVTKTTYVANSSLPKRKTYPSGLIVLNSYTDQGYLKQVRNDADTTDIYWNLPVRDADGHFTRESYGNGIVTHTGYDERTGLPDRITAGDGNGVQDLTYKWESSTLNLISRQDANQQLVESLAYDALNRLTYSVVNANAVTPPQATTYAYDTIGNLICKSDLGTCSANNPNYTYGAQISTAYGDAGVVAYIAPHAIASITGSVHGVSNPTFTYDGHGNVTTFAGRTLSYTSFEMPATISSGTYATAFTYGPEHQRVRQVSSGSGVSREIIYLHPDQANGLLYEQETFNGTVSQNHYITAHGVVIAKLTLENGVWKKLYMHQDNLGSVTAITDESGNVVERMAFDAWGKRRFANGTTDPSGTIHADTTVKYNTDRGYTNHEMLDAYGLIHMNGRIYDPVIARFLSPDPTVPDPEWLQDLNRYSYVTNNPFSFTDPTGFDEEGQNDNEDDLAGPTFQVSGPVPATISAKDDKGVMQTYTVWGKVSHDGGLTYAAYTNKSSQQPDPASKTSENPSALDSAHTATSIASIAPGPVGMVAAVLDFPTAIATKDYLGASLDLISLAGLGPVKGVLLGAVKGAKAAGKATEAVEAARAVQSFENKAEALSSLSKEAPNFDIAREAAFEKAGMKNPADVVFSKEDPLTGTIVEFQGKDGAKVAYDAPHPSTPGLHHDVPHIGYRNGVKKGREGHEHGNIPYSGPQHPSRSPIKGQGVLEE